MMIKAISPAKPLTGGLEKPARFNAHTASATSEQAVTAATNIYKAERHKLVDCVSHIAHIAPPNAVINTAVGCSNKNTESQDKDAMIAGAVTSMLLSTFIPFCVCDNNQRLIRLSFHIADVYI